MLKMVYIETNVPIPPSRNERGAGLRLDDMEVGHSRVVPKSRRGSLSTAIYRQKLRQPGWNFTTRVIGDEIRYWRIA